VPLLLLLLLLLLLPEEVSVAPLFDALPAIVSWAAEGKVLLNDMNANKSLGSNADALASGVAYKRIS
jgi:hypothetical protein